MADNEKPKRDYIKWWLIGLGISSFILWLIELSVWLEFHYFHPFCSIYEPSTISVISIVLPPVILLVTGYHSWINRTGEKRNLSIALLVLLFIETLGVGICAFIHWISQAFCF